MPYIYLQLFSHNLITSHITREISLGHETYENQVKFGKKTFLELEDISRNGFYFEGILHQVDVVCCSDWKAGACIEGLNSAAAKSFCRYCFCTKEEIGLLRGTTN